MGVGCSAAVGWPGRAGPRRRVLLSKGRPFWHIGLYGDEITGHLSDPMATRKKSAAPRVSKGVKTADKKTSAGAAGRAAKGDGRPAKRRLGKLAPNAKAR